jgi:mitochondrial fission protein ELM1
MKASRNVWILDEGSQGHLVQSRGMIRELSKMVPVKAAEILIRPALPGRLGRSLAKRLLRLHPRMWLFRLLYPKTMIPKQPPELIVSSGPHSLTALEFLGCFYHCPNVFIQGTLRIPEGAVTAVMRPFEGELRCDYIFIPLLFTEITPQGLEEAKKEYLAGHPIRPDRPVNTLFIGNSSAKIRFTDGDWDAMIRFVNEQWKRDGRQWLVTTSYRTGIALERRFKGGLQPEALLDAVWYSTEPRKVTKAFLGLADAVYVTMDSLTMLTEAVASGRPTFALCPAESNPTNPHTSYVLNLAGNGLITCIPCGDGNPASTPFAAGEIDYSDSITRVLEKIGWKP